MAPGSAKLDEKVAFCLPSAGRKMHSLPYLFLNNLFPTIQVSLNIVRTFIIGILLVFLICMVAIAALLGWSTAWPIALSMLLTSWASLLWAASQTSTIRGNNTCLLELWDRQQLRVHHEPPDSILGRELRLELSELMFYGKISKY